MVAKLGERRLYVTTRMVAMVDFRGEKSMLLKSWLLLLLLLEIVEAKAETTGRGGEEKNKRRIRAAAAIFANNIVFDCCWGELFCWCWVVGG